MQPDDQIQHPIDYLDSISTVPRKPAGGVSNKLFFGAIISAVLVIIFVGALVLFNSGSDSKENLSRLSVRLENLQKISDDSRKKIVSSGLRATNINLTLALTNGNRDIAEILTANDIDPQKISSSIKDEEKTDELTERLEDARLNAIFDRTYAREMSYELETLIVLIKQLETDTSDDAEKEFLATLRTNLEPLQKQFSDFSLAS
jgi:hypothetical protein